jgi:ferredoxin
VKVTADREVCISAGNCVMSAGALFDQDDDGIVVVLVDEVPESEEDHAPHRLYGSRTTDRHIRHSRRNFPCMCTVRNVISRAISRFSAA